MKHVLVAVATAALSLSVLAPPAVAASPVARDVGDACITADTDDLAFTDVTRYAVAIRCIWRWGITAGTTATTYSPAASATRGQMASFVA